jgi:Beta-propeller repeat/HYDIN/CFA65/VesB-like, Ig-like domain
VAVGGACSSDFPVTAGAFQKTNAGGCDIFVSVFSPTGGQLLYSTLFGGTGYDATFGDAVDASGNVYIGGLTSSPDLPVTGGSVQTIYGGNVDAVVAKFNPRAAGAASLMYSTYLGGSQNDTAADVAVDSLGNAYVCGQTYSSDFPAVNAVQAAKHGTSDAFLVELNPQGSALLFSTYLGGSGDQLADNVTLDRAGNAYVVGWTRSGDFPTTPRAFQPGFAGGATDLFVVKVNPSNAAGVSITPAALNFAPQAVGTTSASQTVIVHNFGSAALTISKVATAGDFAQTNDCHGSVAGGGSCAVSIIFAATSSGSRTGTLSLTDNAGGSPQKIVLTGTGK